MISNEAKTIPTDSDNIKLSNKKTTVPTDSVSDSDDIKLSKKQFQGASG